MSTDRRWLPAHVQSPAIDTGLVPSKNIPSPSVISRFEEIPDIRMATAKGDFNLKHDVHMHTVNQVSTVRKGALKLWERELVEAPEVKRKATVAQLCELCPTVKGASADSAVQIFLTTTFRHSAT